MQWLVDYCGITSSSTIANVHRTYLGRVAALAAMNQTVQVVTDWFVDFSLVFLHPSAVCVY